MLFKIPKRVIFLLVLMAGFHSVSVGQDFYSDYRAYGLSHLQSNYPNVLKGWDKMVNDLRKLTDTYQKKNKKSFFQSDTVYIVNFSYAGTTPLSVIIWNKYVSCYYYVSDDIMQNGYTGPKTKMQINAFGILKSFAKRFRQSIETGDTTAYQKYAYENWVYDGASVHPFMATKINNHWTFLPFHTNGHPVSYEVDLEKERAKMKDGKPTIATTVVEGAIRDGLHFNIDSAMIAYKNNPTEPLDIPVITLDHKVVTLDIFQHIEINDITAIHLLGSTNPYASAYGKNSKYGVVLIYTNGKMKY